MEESEPDEPPSSPQQGPTLNVDHSEALNERRHLKPLQTTRHDRHQLHQITPLSKWVRALRNVTAWAGDAKDLICCSWINVLLVFVPIGICLGTLVELDPGIVFVLNALGIIPLAVIISASTEKLAIRLGDTWGALLNVTVGNTAELMIFFFALAKDQIDIVKASLLGSIATNLLLILGTAFLCGSLRYGHRLRDRKTGRMSVAFLDGALLLAILPVAIFAFTRTLQGRGTSKLVLRLSRGISIALVVVYLCYLLLQMRIQTGRSDPEKRVATRDGHTYIALSNMQESPSTIQTPMKQMPKFAPQGQSQTTPANPAAGLEGATSSSFSSQHIALDALHSKFDRTQDDDNTAPSSPRESSDGSEPTFQATRSSIDSSTDNDSRSSIDSTNPILQNEFTDLEFPIAPDLEEESPTMPHDRTWTRDRQFPLAIAILILILSTALVSVTTELAISRIPHIVASHNISHVLIGFIILPLVGNAAENVTAAKLALKNKTALAKNVAVESSSQITLLIMPAIVLLGWIRGRAMGFNFDMLEVGAVVVTVTVGSGVVLYGKSGWKQGVLLVGTYLCFVVGSVFYKGR